MEQLHSTGLKKYRHINPKLAKDFGFASFKRKNALTFKGDNSTSSLQAYLNKGHNPLGYN